MTFGRFEIGRSYNRRRDIHVHFGGQRQGGISTPVSHPVIFLFTGASGSQHGYADGWVSNGKYRYFGEGQIGDMAWRAGNRAIRDHSAAGKDLLLFQTLGKPGVRFLGEFVCDDFETQQAPDHSGAQRAAIVFELVSLRNLVESEEVFVENALAVTAELDLLTLRQRALAAVAPMSAAEQAAKRNCYRRSSDIRSYVLARANGLCEACSSPAPFRTASGEAYLEPHHIRRLSDGGPDDPRFMGAVCPNCHREIHHGADGAILNQRLQTAVSAREQKFEA